MLVTTKIVISTMAAVVVTAQIPCALVLRFIRSIDNKSRFFRLNSGIICSPVHLNNGMMCTLPPLNLTMIRFFRAMCKFRSHLFINSLLTLNGIFNVLNHSTLVLKLKSLIKYLMLSNP